MKKMIKFLNMFFMQIRQFNFKVAFFWLVASLFSSKNNNIKKHNVLLDYLSNDFSDLIKKHQNKVTVADSCPSDYIWIFWWQGESAAPELIKRNIKITKTVFSDKNIVLIDQDNYTGFIDLPDYMIRKFNENRLSITHLSDIIRVKLLKEYGGLWLDACVIPHGEIPKNIFADNFFSIKQAEDKNYKYVSRGRWIIGVMAAHKNNPLFDFLSDFYNQYWMKYHSVIDYFVFDYAIALAYNNIEPIKKMIDTLQKNNTNLYALGEKGNSKFDSDAFEALSKDTFLFRLPWRQQYQDRDENGNLTYFGFLTNIDKT